MDQRGFGFAGALILVGVAALLWNFNVLPDRFLHAAWSLWPVALVAAWAWCQPGALTGARLAGIAGVSGHPDGRIRHWNRAWGLAAAGEGPVIHRQAIAVNTGNATAARLELQVAAGSLTLDAEAPPGLLLAGELESRTTGDTYSISEAQRPGGRSVIRLNNAAGREYSIFPGQAPSEEWTLHLTPHIPTEIRVDAGAAEIDLDLRNLDLQRLEIKAGAADIDVVMPAAAGKTEASIEVGAASLRITVPEGVAARIEVDAGLSSIQIDEGRFAQLKGKVDVYTSPDFARAANRLDITIEAGASHVEIR